MNALVDMVPAHASVAALIGPALGAVADRIAGQLRSDLPEVEALCRHVERYRGKMLRPTLVLLSGMAAGRGTPTPDHITIGAVLETIHIATLVHDDVLDEADVRRQAPTVNRLRGNDTAVILGDYLLARSFHLCSGLDSQRVALRVGEVTGIVCEGEMLQLSRRGDALLDERTYFDIVERKTAALIGAACELGAAASGADAGTGERMYGYGLKLGVAFQIVDDLLDLVGDQRVVGKSLGKDLEKGKPTLPLIHHLRSAAPDSHSHRCIRALIEGSAGEIVGAGEVPAMLDATGSIAYARGVAGELVNEAKALLAPLPDSPARACLAAMADAVVRREY